MKKPRAPKEKKKDVEKREKVVLKMEDRLEGINEVLDPYWSWRFMRSNG